MIIIITYKCSLFKKCPFEIRKVFKNRKRLLLNTKSMLLSNKKEMPFLNTENVFFQIRKSCCF